MPQKFYEIATWVFSKLGVPEVSPPRAPRLPWVPKAFPVFLGGKTPGTPNFENTQVAISEKLWGMEF